MTRLDMVMDLIVQSLITIRLQFIPTSPPLGFDHRKIRKATTPGTTKDVKAIEIVMYDDILCIHNPLGFVDEHDVVFGLATSVWWLSR